MFTSLPESLQEQILALLTQDKFAAAKALRDAWLSQNQANESAILQ